MGNNVLNEKLCYAGNLSVLCSGNGNIPILTNIKGFAYNIVAGVTRNQSMGYAYAQTAFDHGQKRVITIHLIMRIRFVRDLVQETRYFEVICFAKLDKG